MGWLLLEAASVRGRGVSQHLDGCERLSAGCRLIANICKSDYTPLDHPVKRFCVIWLKQPGSPVFRGSQSRQASQNSLSANHGLAGPDPNSGRARNVHLDHPTEAQMSNHLAGPERIL